MIRCLVTNGKYTAHPERWLAHLALWIARGVDLIQIRERDLTARELASLTRQVLRIPNPEATRILVNDRVDVAMACGAHGVHLRDGSVPPVKLARTGFLVTVSCHSIEDAANTNGAAYVLLGPVFTPLSKPNARPALGIGAIGGFTRISTTPVLALGGITDENTAACIAAGAVGIAGITCFEL